MVLGGWADNAWGDGTWLSEAWGAGDPSPPEPESTQKPAGRKRPRRKLLVEIDGRDFEVSGLEEARALLAQAKQIAAAAIEKARKSPVRVQRGIPRPRITTSAPALKQVVAQASQEIGSLFDALSRDFEIAALMRKQFEDAEEEALIHFLM